MTAPSRCPTRARLIDGIAVRFEGGRIVEAKAAKTGAEVLSKVLDTDEGARRLGEVALVPHSSPIAASGLLFLNTLFDENAASHIALGQAYAKCIRDGGSLSEAELAERRQQQPHPHRLDDRLGEIDLDGIHADRRRVPVFRRRAANAQDHSRLVPPGDRGPGCLLGLHQRAGSCIRRSMNRRSRGAHLPASRPDAEWPYSLSSRK